MNNDGLWERFYQRVRKTNKRYFFEKIVDKSFSNFTLLDLFGWIKNDLNFIFKYAYYVTLNIRKYGKPIRTEYNLSYLQQWLRYTYLMFVLRAYPNHFRTRLLFKADNWNKVNEFIFTQSYAQDQLTEISFKDERVRIENKFEFYKYCKSTGISTPEVINVFQNGSLIYDNMSGRLPRTDLFLKQAEGGKGEGARKFKFTEHHYVDKSDNSYSPEELVSYFKSVSKDLGSVIIQPALTNHASWLNLTSGSLATCRIVTARQPETEDIIPLFCCLKMPVGKLDVDNYMGGAIIVPLDLETGRMGLGVSLHPVERKFEHTHHPDTNYKTDGSVLPHWKELLEFTLSSHKYFKTIIVGWDVAMTTEGCSLIEGNTNWSSGSYEIPFQDSLKNTIYPELFEEWMEKYETSK